MNVALAFERVTAPGLPGEITFGVPRGALAALFTPSRESSELLVRLLLGFEKPDGGAVSLFDRSPQGAGLQALRRRLAVIYPSGGLISNLRVWENLLLPLSYHSGHALRSVEERALAILARLGYRGELMEVPGHLPLFQRRLIGLARAMLMDPELVIYCGSLADLSEAERRVITANILSFHAERPQRTSLFLAADSENLRAIPFDTIITLMETAEHG